MRKQLLDQLMNYVNLGIELDAFDNWLALHIQDILDSGDTLAIDVADLLEASIVQFHESVITEAELFKIAQAMFLKAQTLRPREPEPSVTESGATVIIFEAPNEGRLVWAPA